MLRLSKALWFVMPAVLATGCPMYSDSCNEADDCAVGYLCDAAGTCVAFEDDIGAAGGSGDSGAPERCDTSSDCPADFVCDRYKRCMPSDDSSGGESGAGSPAGGAG